jgi:hypothetical protein
MFGFPEAFYEYDMMMIMPLSDDAVLFDAAVKAGNVECNFVKCYFMGDNLVQRILSRLEDVMGYELYEPYGMRDILYKEIGLSI